MISQKTTIPNTLINRSFLFIALSFIITVAYRQKNRDSDWLKPIVKKHSISIELYSIYENNIVIGKKSVSESHEKYNNVIAIKNSSDNYYICTCESASYDISTRTLNLNNCTEEKFNKNSETTIPIRSEKHVSFSSNFEKKLYSKKKLKPEIKKK